ncbi:hypothetical protein SCATT_08670 [Streptantibioticus cattleyicolor NRRL 8057 = DSM 46488]|uniref:Uncharacterized protein n=1 Tax=Streptantibioticus cattleyicolor (strain ATCC 35852 / DSM 46488 / JCM 4925 / NBRC 14057 / NRRL 8057) TaxID=1003195 RepID=G8X1R5_STREN|nr:hypothetical protein SCATT_08670 [Streptantibioticus cattleyicolor NRRL 8057 = DSM 46488]
MTASRPGLGTLTPARTAPADGLRVPGPRGRAEGAAGRTRRPGGPGPADREEGTRR